MKKGFTLITLIAFFSSVTFLSHAQDNWGWGNETENEIMKENFIYSFLSSVRQKMIQRRQ